MLCHDACRGRRRRRTLALAVAPTRDARGDDERAAIAAIASRPRRRTDGRGESPLFRKVRRGARRGGRLPPLVPRHRPRGRRLRGGRVRRALRGRAGHVRAARARRHRRRHGAPAERVPGRTAKALVSARGSSERERGHGGAGPRHFIYTERACALRTATHNSRTGLCNGGLALSRPGALGRRTTAIATPLSLLALTTPCVSDSQLRSRQSAPSGCVWRETEGEGM